MAFRIVVLFVFVSLARAGVIPSGQHAYSDHAYGGHVTYAQPGLFRPAAVVKAQPVLKKYSDEYDSHPQYKFGYDVQDTLSGDSKRQVESRDGDVVQGEYTLIDADGYKRRVQYTADPVNGFNAIVTREPLVGLVKAVAAPAVVKTVVAPVPVKAVVAPVVPKAYVAPAVLKTVVAPAAIKATVPVSYAKASLPIRYTDSPKTVLRSAQSAYENGPVVKGAYAEKPIVKAVPVAYPVSKEE